MWGGGELHNPGFLLVSVATNHKTKEAHRVPQIAMTLKKYPIK